MYVYWYVCVFVRVLILGTFSPVVTFSLTCVQYSSHHTCIYIPSNIPFIFVRSYGGFLGSQTYPRLGKVLAEKRSNAGVLHAEKKEAMCPTKCSAEQIE